MTPDEIAAEPATVHGVAGNRGSIGKWLHRLAQACGARVKTGAVAACILAMMGASFDLVPDLPAGRNHHELTEWQIACMALIKEPAR